MVDNKSKLKNFSKTRIICTIGPSSYDIQTLKQLIEAGMSVARINLSHGDSSEHSLIINNIRNASKELNNINIFIIKNIKCIIINSFSNFFHQLLIKNYIIHS